MTTTSTCVLPAAQLVAPEVDLIINAAPWRLASFRRNPGWWAAKPEALEARLCALRGWELVGYNRIQATCCDVTLEFDDDRASSLCDGRAYLDEFLLSMYNAHKIETVCPMRALNTEIALSLLSVDALHPATIAHRVQRLSQWKHITAFNIEPSNPGIISALKSICASAGVATPPLGIVLLAVRGWDCVHADDSFLLCASCGVVWEADAAAPPLHDVPMCGYRAGQWERILREMAPAWAKTTSAEHLMNGIQVPLLKLDNDIVDQAGDGTTTMKRLHRRLTNVLSRSTARKTKNAANILAMVERVASTSTITTEQKEAVRNAVRAVIRRVDSAVPPPKENPKPPTPSPPAASSWWAGAAGRASSMSSTVGSVTPPLGASTTPNKTPPPTTMVLPPMSPSPQQTTPRKSMMAPLNTPSPAPKKAPPKSSPKQQQQQQPPQLGQQKKQAKRWRK
eukprot:PhM_4_TR394/c0_g1_i1/m.49671